MERQTKIGKAVFKYWLGPGGVFPYPVRGYVQRGGADKYWLDSDGVLWRQGSMAPCGTEFEAVGELFPNQAGLPSVLYGGNLGEFYDKNVVIGAGAPDCSSLPPMDPAAVLGLLKDAIETTQNQAIFNYLNKIREGSNSQVEKLIGREHIESLASQIRLDIINKFENYSFIKDLGHYIRVYNDTGDQYLGNSFFRVVLLNPKTKKYECIAGCHWPYKKAD